MSMVTQKIDGFDTKDSAAEIQQEELNPYQKEWNSLFWGKYYLKSLKSCAVKGDLKKCHFRSICWKVFLRCLPEEKHLWIDTLKSHRQQYEEILDRFATNPRATDSLDISVNNPLSQCQQSPWNQYFEDSELKITIEQDVVRTFPEIDFFHKDKIQEMMISILFSYAREFPQVSYKQGMHELLAPILFVLQYDIEAYLEYSKENKLDLDILIMLNQNYIEHDAFFLFCKLMEVVKPWYTSSDYSDCKYDNLNIEEPFSQKISSFPANMLDQQLRRIYEQLLKRHDNELFLCLEELEITPQVFGIRWLRLLFGREFSMPDLLVIWDAIFADSDTFDLVNYIFVGMLMSIRQLLLQNDYASCLTHLMRFPNVVDVRYIINLALHLRDPESISKPELKRLIPFPLKSSKYNAASGISKNNSTKSSNNSSLGNKKAGKRPSSFTMTLRPSNSEISTENASGKSYSAVEDQSLNKNANQTESNNFYLENSSESIPYLQNQVSYSFPRTSICNVMESENHTDQAPKIINEGNFEISTALTESSGREMVPLSRPPLSPIKEHYIKNNQTLQKDTSYVKALKEKNSELQLMISYCSEQITLHLNKLQDSMICQKLLHEDEMYLALAGLKRARDILKGTVCFSEEVLQDDLNPYSVISENIDDKHHNSTGSTMPKDSQCSKEELENENLIKSISSSISSSKELNENIESINCTISNSLSTVPNISNERDNQFAIGRMHDVESKQ